MPSRGWALLLAAWLGIAGASLWATTLSPWARASLAILIAGAGGSAIRTCVCLRGPGALRAIERSPSGEWAVELGDTRRRLPAIPGEGCQRFGTSLWILAFDTPIGRVKAVVGGDALRRPAARRLGRCLALDRRRAVTIPAQV